MVPVLSKTTVLILRACSSAFAEVTSTPFVAPSPVAAVTDSGVARPKAHGHAIISTLTAVTNAWASRGCGPKEAQIANVQMAMMMTAGTNTRAIRSASCCTGALVACARATIAMICARTLSPPTWLTRITALPLSAMVAPVTVSPALLCTDADSPVIIDSSISSVPATTTPSAGMRSPALTTTRSPTLSVSMSTVL